MENTPKSINEQGATHHKNPETEGTPRPDAPAPSQNDAKRSCHCYYKSPYWGWKILEGAALIAAIAYAIITWNMWRDSHKNFAVDERAWLSVESAFPGVAKEQIPLTSDVLIRNTGKTFAKKIVSQYVILILRNTERVQFDYSRTGTGDLIGIMPPNGVAVFGVTKSVDQPSSALLTKEQADDLVSGRSYLVVYGKGAYTDIFGETHWFRHCNWKSYYPSGTYAAPGCTRYNDAGDGEPPKD